VFIAVALVIGQSAIYKIHEYERGLHLRGGKFLAVNEPGWHVQIPLIDTVILVKVNERLGYVERINAVTADNLSMVISLQYTYRVTDPRTFALNVDDPERILFEFVQGKLRDVANTRSMADMMSARVSFNEAILNNNTAWNLLRCRFRAPSRPPMWCRQLKTAWWPCKSRSKPKPRPRNKKF